MKIDPWMVVVALVAFGGGVAATQLVPTAQADDMGGEWKCYAVDRLPDTVDAADWRGARKYAEGLNKAAPSAPKGTVITGMYPAAGMGAGQAPIFCAKT